MEIPAFMVPRVGEILSVELITQEARCEAAEAANTPFVIYGARVFQDGNMFSALHGPDLMQGFAAFGDTPAKAVSAFNKAWNENAKEGQL